MAKLDPLTHYHVEGECWVWNGAKKTGGHATMYGRGLVGRIFYQEHVRPLRKDEVLRRNPDCRRGCVNPTHHEPVPRGDFSSGSNGLMSRGHPRRTPNLCGNDLHDITQPGSLYFAPDGRNRCRACDRESNRRRQRRDEIKRCGCGTPVGQAV